MYIINEDKSNVCHLFTWHLIIVLFHKRFSSPVWSAIFCLVYFLVVKLDNPNGLKVLFSIYTVAWDYQTLPPLPRAMRERDCFLKANTKVIWCKDKQTNMSKLSKWVIKMGKNDLRASLESFLKLYFSLLKDKFSIFSSVEESTNSCYFFCSDDKSCFIFYSK